MKDIAYPEKTVGLPLVEEPKMTIRNANVFYGEKQAIYNVELDIAKNEVLAMIGPSGCGKSTLLRCLNRMNDTIVGCRVEGEICLERERSEWRQAARSRQELCDADSLEGQGVYRR